MVTANLLCAIHGATVRSWFLCGTSSTWRATYGSGTGAPNTYTRLLKAMDYNTSGKKPLMVKGGGLTLTTYL